MSAMSRTSLPGLPRSPRDDEGEIIERLMRAAAAAGVQASPRFITDFYATLQTQRLVILAGPPHSGKVTLVRSLARVLTGGHPFQWQMMVGHAWWAGQSGNVGLFTQAQTRFNSAKILTMMQEALRPENVSRVYIACLTRISPAEVLGFFSDVAFQMRHKQLMRLPCLHLPKPILYPPNLFLIGTMDTTQTDWADADLLSNPALLQWPAGKAELRDKIIPANHIFSEERRWSLMAKDPVCGMEVDEQKAAGKSEYKGRTYYFCSPGCKTAFDKEPEKYVGQAHEHGSHHHH